ncbi:MAG TPA: DUF393 domain-containing protein [Actinomycetota bacterium]|jgi:predicted DCC family thiol-disulfide oxidoreductase YuxK|nr:DUF393 domain-containing protein [Actinomycetota bacterium]
MERATVLFDLECGFCRWTADRLAAWDRRGRLRFVALQEPEADRLLPGMPEERKMGSWHLVLPNGRVRSAGDAVAPLMRRLPGGGPIAALATALPGPTERLYAFVSRHRDGLAQVLGPRRSCVDPRSARRPGDRPNGKRARAR